MTGNDVICRSLFVQQRRISNPRYVNKLFLPDEQATIFRSSQPEITHGVLWALKESAYKVWMKQGGIRSFNPKKFWVMGNPEGRVKITTPGGIVWGRAEVSENYISAIAVSAQNLLSSVTSAVVRKPEVTPGSLSVRAELIRQMKKVFPGKKEEDFLLYKTDRDIPGLEVRGLDATIDLSFSHHGHFVSYAFLIHPYD